MIDPKALAEAIVVLIEEPGWYIDIGKWDAGQYRAGSDDGGMLSLAEAIIERYQRVILGDSAEYSSTNRTDTGK